MKQTKSYKKTLATKKNKHGDSLEGMLELKDITSETKREIEKELNRRARRNKKA